MAIRRERGSRPSLFDELPPAKLYLDEVEEIVSILTTSQEATAEFSVSYSIGDLRCDTIEDLQQIGGRTTSLRIDVTESRGEIGIPSTALPQHSWLNVQPTTAYLELVRPSDKEFWTKRGKIREIFDSNSIWWRRATQAFFRRIPWWGLGLLTLAALLVDMSPLGRRTIHLNQWDFLAAAAGVFALVFLGYVCLFRHTVVVLRYAHERRARKWLREHATQILLTIAAALLGALAKGVIDHLWPRR